MVSRRNILKALSFSPLLGIPISQSSKNSPLRIYYPTGSFRADASLVDPSDVNFVWQYYLIENLSCGLVRDSINAPIGYEGCLSERFYQPSSKEWVFHLRKLKWSDGTEIKKQEIENWLAELKSGSSRHVQLMNKASVVEYDHTSRVLRIGFDFEIGTRLLHELSLADAGLFPTSFKTSGWKRTVGPYFVKEWSYANRQLDLVANPLSPLFSESMPKKVTLFAVINPVARQNLIMHGDFDVCTVPTSIDPKTSKQLCEATEHEYLGHPNHISFFTFNRRNSNSMTVGIRRDFAAIIHSLQKQFGHSLEAEFPWRMENQMVPEGYHGRLFSAPDAKFHGEIPKKLTIRFIDSYQKYPSFLAAVNKAFLNHGVELKIVFENENVPLNDDVFATMDSFVANQRDPSGSWSFLSTKTGALANWTDQIGIVLEDALTSDLEKQNQLLTAYHSNVLSKYLLVPTYISGARYYFNNGWRPEGWNKFDSRVRIYQLRKS